MAKLTLRTPWTSQPQTAVRVNRSNPLTKGLIAYILPVGLEVRGLHGPTNGKFIRVGPSGRYTSADSKINPGGLNSSSMSLVAKMYLGADPNAYPGIIAYHYTSAADRFQFGVVWNDATNKLTPTATRNSALVSTSSAGVTLSMPFDQHLMVTVDNWSALKLYLNASSTASASDTAIGTYADDIRKQLYVDPLTPCAYAFFFDRVLSNAEDLAIRDNPWQLFEPIQRTIWVPSAGGGPTYTLTAASGSFALTGQDAGLVFNRVLAADTQSYTLTGQTTGLAFNRTLAAASGSFALTGQDAGLAFNRVLSAANGSYALDGQDVTLTYTPISGATYTLGAASGSFALTGQDTGLAFNRVLTADTQSYSLSGDVAGLAFNRVLTADTVSYALTGQDVALTYTSNGFTYTLTAESGSFEVAGQDASFRHTQNAIAGGGGWLPQTRRKSRKQIYEERVKLGILPPPVIKAAAKVAAVAQTVEEFKEERPKYEEMFLKAIKKTEWLPDYTRAIQAQLAIMEQEEEELLLLL